MVHFQPVRPGAWGRFSTPQVVNKTIISGSFNNYGGGMGMHGCGGGMPMMGMGMPYGMDYGCCGGGGGGFWGGFLGGFLGGIANFFGLGGNTQTTLSYGPGGGGGGNDALDMASLQKLYPDHKFSQVGDTYVCVTKDGKQIRGNSPEDLLNKLGGGAESVAGDPAGEKTIKGKAQLQEECDTFNAKYKDKGATLEVITDPKDKDFGDYKLTMKGADGKDQEPKIVKTVIEAQKALADAEKPEDKKLTEKDFTDLFPNKKLPEGCTLNKDKDGNITGITYKGKTYSTPEDLQKALDAEKANGGGGAGGAGGAGDAGDDGGRGSVAATGAENLPEGFKKLFGEGKLPDTTPECKVVKDGEKTVVEYNGQKYETPDALMKAINGVNLVSSDGFQLSSLNGQTMDIIDHGKIDDIKDAKAGTASSDGKTIQIGSHTYEVVSTDDTGHVYLKAQGARQDEVYILEKGDDGKYRLSEYKYTESGQTRGNGKAAFAGRGTHIA